MNIAKYFDKNSKKRNLSGDSNSEEERKKSEMVALLVPQTTVMFSEKDWSHQNVRKSFLIV